VEVVASLSQGLTAAAQCGFLHTNQSRSYLNHLVHIESLPVCAVIIKCVSTDEAVCSELCCSTTTIYKKFSFIV